MLSETEAARRPVEAVLECLGGPRLTVHGSPVVLAEGSLRTLVYLALRRRTVSRRVAAADLWPTVGETRSRGNLRSALWRLRGSGIDVVHGSADAIGLCPNMVVDVHELDDWAGQWISDMAVVRDLRIPEAVASALDLLPGWYDDWAIIERERLRARLMRTLELASARLSAAGRHAEAVEAALVAVCADPLRESAQRALIGAHLAEGNQCDARRAYLLYAGLLHRELGVPPSPDLAASCFPGRRARAVTVSGLRAAVGPRPVAGLGR